MNLGMCVLCALFGICFMWLDTMASEASESKRSCVTGPFNFEDGKDGWNTTDTKWHRKCSISDFGFNYFMSASLSRKYAASSTLTSPSLCATHNGTYLLSFRYSISGLVGYTPCFLAVNLLREDGVSTRIWRSSGLTHSIFQTVSPPVMFRSCSSQFRLEFEAVKVTSGPCGLILGTAFDFDDVRYLHVGDNTSSNDQCSVEPPKPPRVWSKGIVLALIVAVSVVVIVIAALVLVAVMTKRKRNSPRVGYENDKVTMDYRTFPRDSQPTTSAEPLRQSAYYESVDGGDTPLLPSAGSDDYNRLRRGGTGQAEAVVETYENTTPSAYDHFSVLGGNRAAYGDLRREQRSRDLQRQIASADYHHV
ncbi:uncharacterized protein LOC143286910 isoform X2 [Babylonia areolata]|uniref:uncharacterized protein LOC143286910 isoform X2 n=1 Tax=Babylonia areolata TaxID=304850 RepID=UPI003FD06DA7